MCDRFATGLRQVCDRFATGLRQPQATESSSGVPWGSGPTTLYRRDGALRHLLAVLAEAGRELLPPISQSESMAIAKNNHESEGHAHLERRRATDAMADAMADAIAGVSVRVCLRLCMQAWTWQDVRLCVMSLRFVVVLSDCHGF